MRRRIGRDGHRDEVWCARIGFQNPPATHWTPMRAATLRGHVSFCLWKHKLLPLRSSASLLSLPSSLPSSVSSPARFWVWFLPRSQSSLVGLEWFPPCARAFVVDLLECFRSWPELSELSPP